MNSLQFIWPRLTKLIPLWVRHAVEEDPKKSFETVVAMSEALSFTKSELQDYLSDLRKNNPSAMSRIESLTDERLPPVEELLRFAPDTFGRELGVFLKKNNITPESFPRPVNDSIEERLKAHFYEFHDAWHVITGFDADDAGELALQAFGVGQDSSDVFAMSILSSGLLGIGLRRPSQFLHVVGKVIKGYRIGREAKNFVGQPWLQWLDRPLHEIRTELGVKA